MHGLLNRVGKEVNLVALLVALVETGRLSLSRWCGIQVEQGGGVLLLELASSSLFLFLAKLDGFSQVIVSFLISSAFALLAVLFFLVLAGF